MRTDETQASRFQGAVIKQVEIERIVKGIVKDQLLMPYYIIFAKECVNRKSKHSSLTLLTEIEILQQKWSSRGLDLDVMDRIKDALSVPHIMGITEEWLNQRYWRLDAANDNLRANTWDDPQNIRVNKRFAVGSGSAIMGRRVIVVNETTALDEDFSGIHVDVTSTVKKTHPNWLHGLKFIATYSGDVQTDKIVGVYGTTRQSGTGQLDKAVGLEGGVRSANTGLLVSAMGNQSSVILAATGNITNAYGYRTYFELESTGSITNLYGYRADTPIISGAGTITNYYGFYARPSAVAGVNYGFYQEGAGSNYFEGGLTTNNDVHSNTKVRADTCFNHNATDGISQVVVIPDAAGSTHTLTFSGGILTGYSKV